MDAVRDIDDALCMIFLFSSLPSNGRVSPSLVENCARLAAEWRLYIMHTRSLRKTFLSIKGIYYQAEVMDQTVTWVVPYQFTQHVCTFHLDESHTRSTDFPWSQIPSDVDVRVMLTFLELYQTLLGFVFFKLYTDSGLVYPPPLDTKKDEGGAGVGAFSLQETTSTFVSKGTKSKEVEVDGKKVSSKDVRQTIKGISALASRPGGVDANIIDAEEKIGDVDEDFVAQPSRSDTNATNSLPTLQSIKSLPQSISTNLFAPYTFFLSRETSRPIFEFIVRSFGGRIGWSASTGSGSPVDETDGSITHVIIDRPLVEKPNETPEERERRLQRKYIQPQWVVDCINAGKILLEEPYAQGKTLPPHLSPFGDYKGAYDPTEAKMAGADGDESNEEVNAEDDAENQDSFESAAAVEIDDLVALRAAELSAEAAGVDYGTFEKDIKKSRQRSKKGTVKAGLDVEMDMNKMMMSNKKRKLYERMKHGERKRAAEVCNPQIRNDFRLSPFQKANLESKKQSIAKEKKRQTRL